MFRRGCWGVTKMAAVAIMLVGLSMFSLGQALEADAFTCSGEDRGALCWLSDARLRDTATWRFTNVSSGAPLPLIVEGTADDLCETCQIGRDVLVRVYYQAEGDPYWQRVELWLRNVAPNPDECLVGYPVRGEARIIPPGPNLVLIVQRVLSCDPHVGFSWGSLTLGAAPPIPVVVPLPTLPTPPPPPPPPPPEPTCLVGTLFTCSPGDPTTGCLPAGLNLRTVTRQTLPDTSGPDESAVILQPGHYIGRLGEDDFHDWYRIRTTFGEALIVWVDPGNLVLDVFLIHDPCGDVLAQCLEIRGTTTTIAPCFSGMQCGLNGECFLSGECKFFIRIVRRSGTGDYRLSILTGTPVSSP